MQGWRNCAIPSAAGVLLLAASRIGAAGDVDLAAAERQFVSSCGVCHVIDPAAPPRQGPPLAGVLGRPAASIPDYAYSDALKASGFVWDEQSLDRWLENAQAVVPGTTMLYRQASPERRQLIIAYLRSLGGSSD